MPHIFDCVYINYIDSVNSFKFFVVSPISCENWIHWHIKKAVSYLLTLFSCQWIEYKTIKKLKDVWSYFVFTESYCEYFTTPYFVFIRDTLSYLVLLGLHVALCLESSTIPFSGLEWAILVFFLGRILMESRQFLDVKVQQRRLTATKDFRGSKYQICSETEEETESSPTRGTPFLQRCKKYLR